MGFRTAWNGRIHYGREEVRWDGELLRWCTPEGYVLIGEEVPEQHGDAAAR